MAGIQSEECGEVSFGDFRMGLLRNFNSFLELGLQTASTRKSDNLQAKVEGRDPRNSCYRLPNSKMFLEDFCRLGTLHQRVLVIDFNNI